MEELHHLSVRDKLEDEGDKGEAKSPRNLHIDNLLLGAEFKKGEEVADCVMSREDINCQVLREIVPIRFHYV